MKRFFSINPTGEFLRDYCYVNLWSYENEISLLSGGNIIEKIQFYFLRRSIKKKIQVISNLIYQKECFELETLLDSLNKVDDEIWDWLLYYIIIRIEAKSVLVNTHVSLNERMNSVLTLYLEEIKKLYADTYDIIKLKIKIIETQNLYDLEFAKNAAKQKIGKFALKK